jgi:hypothetical protein
MCSRRPAMRLDVVERIRQIVHKEAVVVETMAHHFEHDVALLYGEGLEPEELAALEEHDEDAEREDSGAARPTAHPAARDAAKYAH